MTLRLAMERPEAVLAKGIHGGYVWFVMHNCLGHRCGYVRIPNGHPWHGLGEPDEADVHGGITFAEDEGDDGDGWWLGFDCAHFGDAPDPDLMIPDYRKSEAGKEMIRLFDGIVRTQAYVQAECWALCEQAAKAAQKGEAHEDIATSQ